jgi:serine/threonine-protein kinase BUR1
MKAANLLIDNCGLLQIADFGLARPYSGRDATEGDPVFPPPPDKRDRPLIGRMDRYTNCVVTRWYRPPELLMGARVYGAEVDMWGVGYVNSIAVSLGYLTINVSIS